MSSTEQIRARLVAPMQIMSGGSAVEALGGGAAAVLAILGLAGAPAAFMAPIATIAIGIALWFEGGAIAARYSRILDELDHERAAVAEVGGGAGAELLGGAAGAILGILALIGVAWMVLTPVALLVYGAALLLGSAVTSRVNTIASLATHEEGAEHRLAREAVWTAVGGQVLSGLGAVVLGILALVGIAPTTLTLVGLLAVGAAVLLSGTAVGGRMLTALHA